MKNCAVLCCLPACLAAGLPCVLCVFCQLRLMCQFDNQVAVEVLPPYIPSQDEQDNPAVYAANIRKLIVSAYVLVLPCACVSLSSCHLPADPTTDGTATLSCNHRHHRAVPSMNFQYPSLLVCCECATTCSTQ